jgi:hypothetical protein
MGYLLRRVYSLAVFWRAVGVPFRCLSLMVGVSVGEVFRPLRLGIAQTT